MLRTQPTLEHHVSCRHRQIGEAGSPDGGPTLLCVCAQHGNEPSGLKAIQRVLDAIEARNITLHGQFVGLVGNLAALRNHSRFMEQDLNRMWTAERVHNMTRGLVEDHFLEHLVAERYEQAQLIQAIEHVVSESQSIAFLDLHTTSAPSAPFTVVLDRLANRKFAAALPVTTILGLEEVLEGTIGDYFDHLGPMMGFEAGQHDDPKSVDLHESAIWLAMVSMGILKSSAVPEYSMHASRLRTAAAGLPPVVEVRDHHRVHDGDQFVMQPGYDNFQAVREGEHLADDRHRRYHAREDGLVFMPLYQRLGEDGYFIVRPVPWWWLRLTGALRRMRMCKLLPMLRAIRRDASHPAVLRVNESRAGWWTWTLLHWLGFRRGRRRDGELIVARTLYDLGHEHQPGELISCTNKPLRDNAKLAG